MIVVYADGGGLGHLTRVQAVRHTLDLDGPITVLTSSHHADDDRVAGGLQVIPIPVRRDDLDARRSWIQRTVADIDPTLLIVDAFPAGLAGEIDSVTIDPTIPAIHLARLLRWEPYHRVLPARPLRYQQTYVLEPLHDQHRRHLGEVSDRLGPLELRDPDLDPSISTSHRDPWPAHTDSGGRPRWLIVHTGPSAEVAELVAYARDHAVAESADPLLVVATPTDAAPPAAADLVLVDQYPLWPLFATADRIYSAAGFNAMRQLAPHRERHHVLAMPRRYDDQPERARRARRTFLDRSERRS